MTELTRRTLLAGSALTAGAAALPIIATQPVQAAAPAFGKQVPGFYRFKLGDFELTAINDGTWFRTFDEKFVRNASLGEVQKALSDAFLPTDRFPLPYTTLVVNTGSRLIALDTGTGGQFAPIAPQSGTFAANLAAAGIDAKSVDAIYISHFHPDHINGIKTKDNALFFPNAEISVSAPEWAFWMDDANMSKAPESDQPYFKNARRIFGDIAAKVKRFDPGKEVESGITTIAAFGHTPGHVAFAIASGGQSMLALSDTASNPWLFVRNPDWQGSFDMDGNLAVDTRKKLLDRAAADRMLVQGYHFPFPASGHLAKTAKGYELVPVLWQSTL